MRLDQSSQESLAGELSSQVLRIRKELAGRMNGMIAMSPTSVMLKDGTVTKQDTFDPDAVRRFLGGVVSRLDGWSAHDISESKNEDVRRIFVKFDVSEGSYRLSGHLSLQYHVLLYYKPDHKVMECQRELAEIMGATEDVRQKMSYVGDRIVSNRLREMGHGDLDHQELFELLYHSDSAREDIYDEISYTAGSAHADMERRKSELLKELDDLLIETYQTSQVLIDDIRLVAGEEGYLCTFDLEHVKDGVSQGLFDVRRVPERVGAALRRRLEQALEATRLA